MSLLQKRLERKRNPHLHTPVFKFTFLLPLLIDIGFISRSFLPMARVQGVEKNVIPFGKGSLPLLERLRHSKRVVAKITFRPIPAAPSQTACYCLLPAKLKLVCWWQEQLYKHTGFLSLSECFARRFGSPVSPRSYYNRSAGGFCSRQGSCGRCSNLHTDPACNPKRNRSTQFKLHPPGKPVILMRSWVVFGLCAHLHGVAPFG